MKLKELFAVMPSYSEDEKKPDPNLCPFLLTIGEDQHNFLLYTYEGDFKSKDGKMNKDDAKKLIATEIISHLVKNVNDIKKILNIERTDINGYDELEMQLFALGSLVKMLVDNSLDDILKQQLFDEYLTDDDEDDNPFETVLNLHKNDIPNMSFIVTSIREDYFASLDEDEE